MSDRETLEQAANGDADALGRLYDRYAPMLYQFALALTRRRDAAEEVVQNPFLGLLRSRSRLGRVENIRAYLLRVARNEGSHLRRHPEGGSAVLELVETSSEMPVTEVVEVNEALSRLPEEQLTVVVLKGWQGMTFAEIAQALGIPANTAASRYRYAMEKLRRWLT